MTKVIGSSLIKFPLTSNFCTLLFAASTTYTALTELRELEEEELDEELDDISHSVTNNLPPEAVPP